jgi:hypothetical protein
MKTFAAWLKGISTYMIRDAQGRAILLLQLEGGLTQQRAEVVDKIMGGPVCWASKKCDLKCGAQYQAQRLEDD